MNRNLLIVALTLVASIAFADESAKPAKPIGTWRCEAETGHWNIAFENSRLVVTAHGPGERVTTLTAPRYEISEEGVVFGYFGEVASVSGTDELRAKEKALPFAFRFKVKGETLTVSDSRCAGITIGSQLDGDYKKEATDTASKPESEVKR